MLIQEHEILIQETHLIKLQLKGITNIFLTKKTLKILF